MSIVLIILLIILGLGLLGLLIYGIVVWISRAKAGEESGGPKTPSAALNLPAPNSYEGWRIPTSYRIAYVSQFGTSSPLSGLSNVVQDATKINPVVTVEPLKYHKTQLFRRLGTDTTDYPVALLEENQVHYIDRDNLSIVSPPKVLTFSKFTTVGQPPWLQTTLYRSFVKETKYGVELLGPSSEFLQVPGVTSSYPPQTNANDSNPLIQNIGSADGTNAVTILEKSVTNGASFMEVGPVTQESYTDVDNPWDGTYIDKKMVFVDFEDKDAIIPWSSSNVSYKLLHQLTSQSDQTLDFSQVPAVAAPASDTESDPVFKFTAYRGYNAVIQRLIGGVPDKEMTFDWANQQFTDTQNPVAELPVPARPVFSGFTVNSNGSLPWAYATQWKISVKDQILNVFGPFSPISTPSDVAGETGFDTIPAVMIAGVPNGAEIKVIQTSSVGDQTFNIVLDQAGKFIDSHNPTIGNVPPLPDYPSPVNWEFSETPASPFQGWNKARTYTFLYVNDDNTKRGSETSVTVPINHQATAPKFTLVPHRNTNIAVFWDCVDSNCQGKTIPSGVTSFVDDSGSGEITPYTPEQPDFQAYSAESSGSSPLPFYTAGAAVSYRSAQVYDSLDDVLGPKSPASTPFIPDVVNIPTGQDDTDPEINLGGGFTDPMNVKVFRTVENQPEQEVMGELSENADDVYFTDLTPVFSSSTIPTEPPAPIVSSWE